MSRFVRSNTSSGDTSSGAASKPAGLPNQRLYGQQVAVGEPLQLESNSDFIRDVQSSLEIIAQERLLEIEVQAKALLIRAKEESDKILDRANSQARDMLTQAQNDVDSIREIAHEEGFKVGFQEGYTDATNQVSQETQNMLAGAQVLVEGAYLAEKRVLKHFEGHMVDIVRHVVQQILHREMQDSPATVLHLVERALEGLYMSGKVQVVVSDQIIQELRQYATTTAESLDAMKRFEFVADPVLDRDQIYIIGQEGSFDLSPDTQLENMLSPLEAQLNLPRSLPDDVAGVAEESGHETDSIQLSPQTEPVVPANALSTPTANGVGLDAGSLEALADDPASTESIELADGLSEAPTLTSVSETNEIPSQPAMAEVPMENELASDALVNLETDVQSPPDPMETTTVPTETKIYSSADADPVAWEEFPPDIQELGGFVQEPSGEADIDASVGDVSGEDELSS